MKLDIFMILSMLVEYLHIRGTKVACLALKRRAYHVQLYTIFIHWNEHEFDY